MCDGHQWHQERIARLPESIYVPMKNTTSSSCLCVKEPNSARPHSNFVLDSLPLEHTQRHHQTAGKPRATPLLCSDLRIIHRPENALISAAARACANSRKNGRPQRVVFSPQATEPRTTSAIASTSCTAIIRAASSVIALHFAAAAHSQFSARVERLWFRQSSTKRRPSSCI